MKLLTQSTPLALWYDIIHEAQERSGILLKEDVESYVVLLLMRYIKRADLATQILACDYLKSFNLAFTHRSMVLQEVGDKCLLFAGLFPKRAEKRLVSISYFVGLGQSAYSAISALPYAPFEALAKEFVTLMEILHTLHSSKLLPLEIYYHWNTPLKK